MVYFCANDSLIQDKSVVLQKGTLWQSILRTSEHARSVGALLPVKTDHVFIENSGMRFFVRVLAGLRQKDEARKRQDSEAMAGKTANPFLTPEKDLIVGDVSESHIAILNKFNVVDHHLLIITREFEDQDMLLTPQDFEALWLCMAEYEGLVFYNGGRDAGASQQHKHLQMVPLPLAPEGPAVPIEPLLANAMLNTVGSVPGLPFQHAFVRLDPAGTKTPLETARTTFALYYDMLQGLGFQLPRPSRLTRQTMPYCFIVTRNWMLLVPRTKEFFEDISLNSLAFVGSFFIRNETQLSRLKSVGPMHALRSVAR
jgi:sulfate adenylyltransferase (ADP) / ATP adenylyltransferase